MESGLVGLFLINISYFLFHRAKITKIVNDSVNMSAYIYVQRIGIVFHRKGLNTQTQALLKPFQRKKS